MTRYIQTTLHDRLTIFRRQDSAAVLDDLFISLPCPYPIEANSWIHFSCTKIYPADIGDCLTKLFLSPVLFRRCFVPTGGGKN